MVTLWSKVQAKKLFQAGVDIVQMRGRQARIHSQPKGLIHHRVSVYQSACNTVFLAYHVRLARQVTGKE
jgi:hypothetical protein